MRGMNVVFVEPFFPSNQRQFARALAEAGATVIGIGEYGAESFDDDLKGWLHHYERVSSVTDVEVMTRAVRWVQDKLWVDRIEATIEAHIMAGSIAREMPVLLGWPLILMPIHILFLQLIIDPSCSIVFEAEPEGPDTMERPPRPPEASLLDRATVLLGCVQGAVAGP